ncbi:hypothetical protein GLA29479_4548 [Lysobacter antibioticus]|nr:hypothetical protein GLA29479_4548 [Lysobacter antibioticus]
MDGNVVVAGMRLATCRPAFAGAVAPKKQEGPLARAFLVSTAL